MYFLLVFLSWRWDMKENVSFEGVMLLDFKPAALKLASPVMFSLAVGTPRWGVNGYGYYWKVCEGRFAGKSPKFLSVQTSWAGCRQVSAGDKWSGNATLSVHLQTDLQKRDHLMKNQRQGWYFGPIVSPSLSSLTVETIRRWATFPSPVKVTVHALFKGFLVFFQATKSQFIQPIWTQTFARKSPKFSLSSPLLMSIENSGGRHCFSVILQHAVNDIDPPFTKKPSALAFVLMTFNTWTLGHSTVIIVSAGKSYKIIIPGLLFIRETDACYFFCLFIKICMHRFYTDSSCNETVLLLNNNFSRELSHVPSCYNICTE